MNELEYYEKYKDNILMSMTDSEKNQNLVQSIFGDFSEEVLIIIKQRKAQCQSALASIISEQNQKWNKLECIIEKNHSFGLLREDGFAAAWADLLKKV